MLRHAKVAVKFEKGVQVDGTKTGFSLLFYFSLWYSVVVGLLCRVRGVVLIRFVLGHPVACAQRVLCAPHTHESLVRKSRGRERATAAGAHLSPSFVLSRFFFPPVCPAKRRRVSGRREHLFSANVSAGLYWRLVRGLLGCVTFIKRRPRRLGS